MCFLIQSAEGEPPSPTPDAVADEFSPQAFGVVTGSPSAWGSGSAGGGTHTRRRRA